MHQTLDVVEVRQLKHEPDDLVEGIPRDAHPPFCDPDRPVHVFEFGQTCDPFGQDQVVKYQIDRFQCAAGVGFLLRDI